MRKDVISHKLTLFCAERALFFLTLVVFTSTSNVASSRFALKFIATLRERLAL